MRSIRVTVLSMFMVALVAGWASGAPQQKDKPAGKQRPGVRPGEINTPPAKGERHSDSLKVGDVAPDFTLADPEGKKTVTLSSFQGKQPVVLVFGSFT